MKNEPPSSFESAIKYKKVLFVNEEPAIQFHSHSVQRQDSLRLKENMLLFVTQGNILIRHGNLTYHSTKNQIVFLKKDILIEFQPTMTPLEGLVKTEFILISIKRDLIKEFTKMIHLSPLSSNETPPVSIHSPGKRLQSYFNSISTYFIDAETIGDNLVKIKLLELLFYLAETEGNIFEQLLDLREQYRSNITSVVEENIMNSISLNQLASLAGRSLSSFRRDFQAIYNMPPSQWIRQKRLEKAREMLQCTTMTITDICYSLGFENIAHFSRVFKSHFKCPPTTYRLNGQVA